MTDIKPTVALDTLGCKLNQAETELLAKQFTKAGYRLVRTVDMANVYVLNTCTVTHIADRKSRQLLRQAYLDNPSAQIVATGCYAQRAPEELSQIAGVNLILSNKQKPQLVQILEGFIKRAGSVDSRNGGECDNGFRTRTIVKIQDGCNSCCSYCIVPLVRGGERSLGLDHVIRELRQRVVAGYREVVLTGVEIGAYNNNGITLKELLEQILSKTDVSRIRLSSLQPQEVTEELVRLWRDKRLCPHFHLSLQSGSERVLHRMRRSYSLWQYGEAVRFIRSILPQAAITTDVIVGFPGETDAEFKESYQFCQSIEFARIHVFPYSLRQGTQAARMIGQVAVADKKRRSRRMLTLSEESALNFRRRFLGETMDVLFEQQSDGVWSGFTNNYIRVHINSGENLSNKLLPVKLTTSGTNMLGGAIAT